jgi:hypothetical protein
LAAEFEGKVVPGNAALADHLDGRDETMGVLVLERPVSGDCRIALSAAPAAGDRQRAVESIRAA